jgi:predicted nucleic acid-binding protein
MARLQGGIGGTLVLDAEGLSKLAHGQLGALARAKQAYARDAAVVTAATTLTEVLRGGPGDAPIHRILRKIMVVPIDSRQARAAGELLGRAGLSGHRCALDAITAVVALAQEKPAVVLTSDASAMAKLTEEPTRKKQERVSVVRI